MAAQSQGIKKLMQAEKEAAQVVATARKSEFAVTVLRGSHVVRAPLYFKECWHAGGFSLQSRLLESLVQQVGKHGS